MKKLYTILLGALLGTTALSAQITMTIEGETTTKTFTNFKEVLDDVNANNADYNGKTITYTISANVECPSRVLIERNPSQKTTYIFRGEGENITVTRTEGKNNLMTSNKASNVIMNFENLILDGGTRSQDKALIEIQPNRVVNFKNVKFQNVKNSSTSGIIDYVQGGGAATLENVTFGEGIVLNENAGMVNVNSHDLTIKGSTNLSYRITAKPIIIGENFNPGESPVELILSNINSGATVVSNFKDASKFSAKAADNTPVGLGLMNKGNDIIYGSYTVMIGSIGYGSLAEAVTAAVDDDVITLKADQTVTSRLGVDKNVTIKSEGDTPHKIINGISGNSILLLFNNNSKVTEITLENLIIDGNNHSNDRQTIEISNKAHVTMNNIKVINAKNPNGPIVKIMGDAKSTINGLTMENCTWKSDDNAFIFFGNSACQFAGETNVSISLEKNLSVDCSGLILNEPIDVVLNNAASRTAHSDVLRNFTDLQKVNLLTPGFVLEANETNIIANPAVTENSYKIVKCSTAAYDAATAEATGETVENVKVEAGVNKFIVFTIPTWMNAYVETPAADATAYAEGENNTIEIDGKTYTQVDPDTNAFAITGPFSFVLATSAAHTAPVAVAADGGVSSSIDTIFSEDENAPVEYYNLQGIRVENPSNGLYIKRQGNKAVKVLIK